MVSSHLMFKLQDTTNSARTLFLIGSAKRARIAECLTILLGCRKRKHSEPLLLLEDKSHLEIISCQWISISVGRTANALN